ncbi:MAG: GDP-mannose 4,6-dehydratase [Planctomycetaceae bacterium]
MFASSGGVLYGDVAAPADEEHPADPISPYGITKWVGEQLSAVLCARVRTDVHSARYTNVYGPRQNPHGEAGVVAIFCKKMLAGEAPTINGDGKYIRDYVYGPDVAQANVKALERKNGPRFAAYNIGTSVPTDVNQLATQLREHCQRLLRERGSTAIVPPAQYGPARAGDLRSSLVSAAKAERELGWRTTVDIGNGLRQTAEWFAAR